MNRRCSGRRLPLAAQIEFSHINTPYGGKADLSPTGGERTISSAGPACRHQTQIVIEQVSMAERVRVGLIGSGFVSTIHAESLARVPQAEVVAVASATPEHAAAFAGRHGIARHFNDYRQMIELADLDLVVIGTPND